MCDLHFYPRPHPSTETAAARGYVDDMTFYERNPQLLEDRLERERRRLLRGTYERPRRPSPYPHLRERYAELGMDLTEVVARALLEG
jgi:hypothetical protein